MRVESMAGHRNAREEFKHVQLWGAVWFAALRYDIPSQIRHPLSASRLVMQISIEPTFHSVDDAAVDISDSLISIDNDGQVTIGGGGGSSGGGARPTG